MEIIPTINCPDFKCVEKRLEIAKSFGTGWVQIDVSDEDFSGFKTWNNPEEFAEKIGVGNLNFYIEVHLMVKETADIAERWLEAGADRIIVHLESDFDFEKLVSDCEKHKAELMVSVAPETPIEKLYPYLKKTDLAQFLAVDPGPSGQGFQDEVIFKINALLEAAPGVIIEVDGGVDDKIAKRLKNAGVNIAVVGSFIFNSPNPEERYRMLEDSK